MTCLREEDGYSGQCPLPDHCVCGFILPYDDLACFDWRVVDVKVHGDWFCCCVNWKEVETFLLLQCCSESFGVLNVFLIFG